MFKNFEKIHNKELGKHNKKIQKLEAEKEKLQNHVMELKYSNLNLQQNLGHVEQYGRRLCLQIDGVTVRNNESANSILDNVKTMFEEAGINVPDAVVGRAH